MAKDRSGDAWLDDVTSSEKAAKKTTPPKQAKQPKDTSRNPQEEAAARYREKNKQIITAVPHDLARAAKLKAAKEDTSIAHVVRTSLKMWLDGELQIPPE